MAMYSHIAMYGHTAMYSHIAVYSHIAMYSIPRAMESTTNQIYKQVVTPR